jgi:hypothetical protein
MATFGTLYQDALDYELGNNDSSVLFLTAKRKAAINEGYRQFSDLTECWTKESTFSCSHAIGEYNLHSSVNVPGSDFVRLSPQGPTYQFRDASSNWTYTAGEDLPRRDIVWLDAHEPGWRESTGADPTAYYLRGDGSGLYFGLTPPPEISSSELGNVRLPYVARPSSLTQTTAVPWPGRLDLEPYHQALVHYAASKMEKLRKDPQASESQLAAFLGYVQRYLGAVRPRGGRFVRMGRSYFSGTRGSAQTDTYDT